MSNTQVVFNLNFQFIEVLELVPPSEDGPLFKDCFNRQSVSDYIVVYLRLVTSGQLQKESSFFENFIDGERSIASFCHQVGPKIFFLTLFTVVIHRKWSLCIKKAITST